MLKRTILDGISFWSVYQPDKRIDFNGFLWARDGGNLLIDPLPLDEQGAAIVDEAGGAAWILLTNADHLRAAVELKARFGATLLAPEAERDRLTEVAADVDTWYSTVDQLPEPLREDVEVFAIRGGKSAVEIALLLRPLSALLFGDVVRSHAAGRLDLLPDAKLADRQQVIDDVRPLLELPFDAVLLGDGESIYRHGKEALEELLAR